MATNGWRLAVGHWMFSMKFTIGTGQILTISRWWATNYGEDVSKLSISHQQSWASSQSEPRTLQPRALQKTSLPLTSEPKMFCNVIRIHSSAPRTTYLQLSWKTRQVEFFDWNDPKAMTIRKSLGMISNPKIITAMDRKWQKHHWRTPAFPPASPWVMDGPTSIPHFVGLSSDCRVEAIVEVPSVHDLNKERNLRSKS